MSSYHKTTKYCHLTVTTPHLKIVLRQPQTHTDLSEEQDPKAVGITSNIFTGSLLLAITQQEHVVLA